MTSITKLALVTAVCLLSSYGAFGSTVTSTSCSATVGTQTFSQTNPSSCGIYQNATNGRTLYNVTATAYADETTVNDTGRYREGYASVDIYTDYFGSASALSADAFATTTEAFSSAAPSTAGTITFTGNCSPAANNGFSGLAYCYGTITLIDSLGTTSFAAPTCEHDGLFIFCASTTLPIELGSNFTVELSADNVGEFNTPIYDDPSVVFTLAQLVLR